MLSEARIGALMGKIDTKSVFRLIPVRKEDWPLLGYQFNNEFYFDTVLPFGCRSSPFLFSRFADAIHWIVANKSGLTSQLHYVNDFSFTGKPGSNYCHDPMVVMRQTCAELGVPLSAEKEAGPATVLTFLGISLDSVKRTLSFPDDKLEEMLSMLRQWESKKRCSKRELQSLVGSLQFASKCIPSSRLFTRRLIRALPRSATTVLDIDRNMKLDLDWRRQFLPTWNGHASFLEPIWTQASTLHLNTDASATLGLGAFFDGEWFNSRWPEWILQTQPPIE